MHWEKGGGAVSRWDGGGCEGLGEEAVVGAGCCGREAEGSGGCACVCARWEELGELEGTGEEKGSVLVTVGTRGLFLLLLLSRKFMPKASSAAMAWDGVASETGRSSSCG